LEEIGGLEDGGGTNETDAFFHSGNFSLGLFGTDRNATTGAAPANLVEGPRR
jgi:hypothetical protein